MTSIYVPNFSFVFYITIFVLYNSDLYSIFSYLFLIFVHLYSIFLIYIRRFHVSIIYRLYLYSIITFVFNLCSLPFYKRLFIFDVLHLYSIVKAEQSLHNDMCALLGLMRIIATG